MNISDKEKAFLKDLGSHIREIRRSVGISQEELAAKSRVHRTYISSVERGRRNVTVLNLRRIAAALNEPVSSIFPER